MVHNMDARPDERGSNRNPQPMFLSKKSKPHNITVNPTAPYSDSCDR